MNTQVTRPGHMVPGWAIAHNFAEVQEAHSRQAERERRAGDKLARWGLGLLLASLFSGLVWAFLLSAAFEAATALHVIPAAQAVGHVL